jgi:EAL domain-containing protein (putative c-di-GMP-specific phosphodiesterase class I)/CheY-like chemotaxis protein
VKILIVEQHDSRASLARQLLDKYHVDFECLPCASEMQLRTIAHELQPNLVFCADRMPAVSRCVAIDLLRLLAPRTAQVTVVRIGDTTSHGMTFIEDDDAEGDAEAAYAAEAELMADELAAHRGADRTAETWRGALPSLLETSWDAVALSDAAGWITCANINTCVILRDSSAHSLGTVLDARYFTHPEHRLHRVAMFDANGYPTPVHLSDLVARVCERAQGSHTALPIAALHLPGLRVLTDALGSGAADVMLDIADTELRAGGIGCGLVARLGEDDTIVVLPDLARPSDAAIHVQSERREPQRREPRRREPQRLEIPRRAVPAVAPAEAAKINPAMRPAMVDGLGDALRRHAIGVHYQPQFQLDSGRGCGVEALARWYLTSGEAVAPTVFIPAAERAGLIDELGARVLKIACDAAATWRDRESQQLTLSVKVSTLQINNGFSRTLQEVLHTSGIEPQRLELEVAERALLSDAGATTSYLLEWKRMGVRIAVIHAGNDYSSLRYLSKAPIDRLKLDRALIGRMGQTSRDETMVRALIALGMELDIDVIAEGVETEAQLHALMQMRCPQVQGFLLGRPMPLVPVQLALRKPWGNLPKIPAFTSPTASEAVARFLAGAASRT